MQKVSLFMRNLEATVSVFLSKLARNNYSEQSAPSPQSAATAETGAGEKIITTKHQKLFLVISIESANSISQTNVCLIIP